MNNPLMSPFKQNLVVLISFFTAMYMIGLYMITWQTFQDTTYIRQTMQMDEIPVDPFEIVTIKYWTITTNETATITQQLDSVQFVCEPGDISRIRFLMQDDARCGIGYCVKDSIISLEVEHVE